MCQLSEPAQALARQFYALQADRSWRGRSQRDEQSVTLLRALAALDEPAAVTAAANGLHADSAEVRDAARKAVHRLLASVPPVQLLQITTAFVASWAWYASDAWQRLPPAQVSPLAGTGPSRTAVLGLLSFHPNGYVRHEAVRLLGGMHDGSELPFLLIRQNDWVNPISADAKQLVCDRLTDLNLPHLVRALPLLVHLLAYRRRDLSSVVEACVRLLVRAGNERLLDDALRIADHRVRRDVVRLALDLEGEHRRRVVAYGLACDDPVIRLWCARQVRAVISREHRYAVVEALKFDPSMPVRREGLLLDAEISAEGAPVVWRRALLDRSASVRELARFHLKQLGGSDPAPVYRDVLARAQEGPLTVAALQGLGETGDASDLPVIRGLLGASRASVRRAAVRAVAMLGRAGVASELVAYLLDGNPGVVREACRRLTPLVPHVTGGELLVVAMTGTAARARASAVRLIHAMGKWQGLPWLIRVLACDDSSTRQLARDALEGWFSPPLCNRVFTRPTADERRAIDEAIVASRAALGEDFARKLLGWLG